MRVSDGAKGTARNGGNIHVHNDALSTYSPRNKTKPSPPSIQIAPIEIRDAVYRELIRISPAQKYYPHLVDGRTDSYHEDCWNAKHTTTVLCLPPRKNARNSPGNFASSLPTSFPNTVTVIHTLGSLAYPGSGRMRTASFNYGSLANTKCQCSAFHTKTSAVASRLASFDFTKATFRKERSDIAGWHHHLSAGAVAPALQSISLSDRQLSPMANPCSSLKAP
jgi:hypothetical protein